ncbi:MAG: carbohydrate binding domain-containing protein [Candidatus Methanoperedens sp.]
MKSYMCYLILLIYLFAGIEVASATNELPFQRILSVNEWGGQFSTKSNIDQAINDAVYMNVDAIMMQVGSEYFEAVRSPSRADWDSRASWNMLEYAINKSHSKNIQVHVWITVNNANSLIRAERRMWGTRYNTVNINGGKSSRLEIANPIVANYEADLLGFIAKHYPTLDGIIVEEPFYVTQSYSPEIIARVKEKYNGYDIVGKNDQANVLCRGSSMKGMDQSICPTYAKIYDVERDAFNEFFTKLSSNVNKNKSNPDLLLSAGAANGYRPLHGFDPGYMSDNYLLDFYLSQTGASSVSNFKASIDRIKLQVKNIPNVPISAITYTSIYPDVNPPFLQQLEKSCEYGADAEMVFTYAWRNKIFNRITAYEALHRLPPSSLCGKGTIVSAPAFSPPGGTYNSAQTVSISTSTTGAIIHYTKDGTTPTETSATYSSPITISSTTTLKARAWKNGFTPSSTTSAVYTIGVPVLSSITMSPKSVSMVIGSTRAFTTDPKDQFGNTITTAVTWTSSNKLAGTISNSGILTALAEGTTIITAASGSITDTATVVITTPQSITNIIDNPSFESGTSSWNFFTNGTGTFTASSPGYEGTNSAVLALNMIGSNVQLFQNGIVLEPDTNYRLSFAGYSTTGNDVAVILFKHVSPYTNYGLSNTFDLGTSWQVFNYEFTTKGFTRNVSDGRFQFWLSPFASAGDIYYLDNIILEKVSAPSLPLVTTPPESQTVIVGESVTFGVIVDSIDPLSYQWQKNGEDISGETGETYTIPVTTILDNGSIYRVKVTNSAGSVISDNAILELISLPNLVNNPGFESGTTSWTFYTNGSGTFSALSPGYEGNNAGVLALNRIGSNIQLYQNGIVLEPDTNYRLSFSAYSSSGNDLKVRLIQHVSPYASYMPDYIADLGTNWQTFTTEFDTTGLKNNVDGRLMFWLSSDAKGGDIYYIDNVQLENIDDIP